jgi:hypothetical protein
MRPLNNLGLYGCVRLALVSLSALILSACDAGDSNEGPVGVTAKEAEMLDEAAEMLDQRQAELDAEIEKERIVQENLPERSK